MQRAGFFTAKTCSGRYVFPDTPPVQSAFVDMARLLPDGPYQPEIAVRRAGGAGVAFKNNDLFSFKGKVVSRGQPYDPGTDNGAVCLLLHGTNIAVFVNNCLVIIYK